MARKISFKNLKRQDWTGHFIELIIVVLGIFIAFQFANFGQQKKEKQQYQELVLSVKLENDKNREEFEELRVYRKETVRNSKNLLSVLDSVPENSKDSIRYLIFNLLRISTPDLQQQSLESLINSTFAATNSALKNEAIRLKAYYDEWLLSSEAFGDHKQSKLFDFLYDSIDFRNGKILDYEKIFSLRFKNNIWEICGAEEEQSRLYNEGFKQFEKFHELVLKELSE